MAAEEYLARSFIEHHPEDAARILERSPAEDASALLMHQPRSQAASVIGRMAPLAAVNCLEQLPADEAAAIMCALEIHAAARLMRRISQDKQRLVLENISSRRSVVLRSLLKYPEGVVGSLIDLNVPIIPNDLTVEEGLELIRNESPAGSHQAYVVDRDQIYQGAVAIQKLAGVSPQDRLRFLVDKSAPVLSSRARVSTIVALPAWGDHDELPVTDINGIFLGVLTHRRIRGLPLDISRQKSPAELDAFLGLSEILWLGLHTMLEGVASVVEGKHEGRNN